jgi:hypothetical protein
MKFTFNDVFLGLKAAIIASACCSLPAALAFMFVALGFGSVTAAVRVPQYKWVFMAIATVFIVVSLYYRIRQKRGTCSIADIHRESDMILVTVITYAALTLALIYWILPALFTFLFSFLSK